MILRIPILIVLPALVLLSGCAGAYGKASVVIKVDAETIFSSTFGGPDKNSMAFWINDEKDLIFNINRISKPKIGGSIVSVPAVNFEKEGILLACMGQKPTGGYRIELASKQVDVKEQTATVTVNWIEPARDAILTQMITSPCIMIKMTRGSYTTVRVVDQNGVIRAETRIDHPEN
jgi:hypothetical protein